MSATPKQFSAYLVIASSVEGIDVDAILIDKGARLERDWNTINFETLEESAAYGVRLSRVCPDCKLRHKKVGILGHDGDHGTSEVVTEARQVLTDARARVKAERGVA